MQLPKVMLHERQTPTHLFAPTAQLAAILLAAIASTDLLCAFAITRVAVVTLLVLGTHQHRGVEIAAPG
jgi:hypothetical protein